MKVTFCWPRISHRFDGDTGAIEYTISDDERTAHMPVRKGSELALFLANCEEQIASGNGVKKLTLTTPDHLVQHTEQIGPVNN